ncbi:MAG: GNAT family N-acetyltransferase [Flavobacteriaceae bacterium]|nr:GNAT family N-acetyltransferase [Flavobacteriaceae bacterium]
MNFIIRESNKGDMPQVLELIQELATFEREPEAVVVTVEELQREGFGEHPLFKCFVAETDSEIVGMALVYFRFSTWKGRTIHLEDLIVKEKMRGSGLGSALYQEVLKYAKSQGVKRVEWVVLDWNEGAIKFYERSGAKILKDWRTVHMDEQGITNFLDFN